MNEAIIKTINNLLQMTQENGCTEDEAAAAASAVERLLKKHQLKLDEIRYKEQRADWDFGRVVFKPKNSWSALKYGYTWSLVRAIGISLTVAFYRFGDHILMIGEKENCEIARDLYEAVFNGMYKAESWSWRQRKGTPREFTKRDVHYHSFCVGYAEVFSKRLSDERETASVLEPSSVAIVAYKAEALKTAVKEIVGNRVRPSRDSSAKKTGDYFAYQSGRAEGQRAPMSKNPAIE